MDTAQSNGNGEPVEVLADNDVPARAGVFVYLVPTDKGEEVHCEPVNVHPLAIPSLLELAQKVSRVQLGLAP